MRKVKGKHNTIHIHEQGYQEPYRVIPTLLCCVHWYTMVRSLWYGIRYIGYILFLSSFLVITIIPFHPYVVPYCICSACIGLGIMLLTIPEVYDVMINLCLLFFLFSQLVEKKSILYDMIHCKKVEIHP